MFLQSKMLLFKIIDYFYNFFFKYSQYLVKDNWVYKEIYIYILEEDCQKKFKIRVSFGIILGVVIIRLIIKSSYVYDNKRNKG